MSALPLAPVVLVLGGALVSGFARRAATADALSLLVALGACGLLIAVLAETGHGLVVHWFAGWEPREGIPFGVDFAADRVGAGLALFVAILTVLALVMLIRYRLTDPPHLQALILVFCGGMVGFCLSGDLFDMFVFFELMSVSAFGLTAFRARQEEAIEGSLTFAVTNTVGSIAMLLGIALVYARTESLNLAGIGHALAGGGADGLVVCALALIVSGMLVKAAAVPFQAWLADAYAVAPTPVCLLFAGAMSELGIYGIGRVWFDAFEPAFAGHVAAVGDVLVAAGVVTALVGGVMCVAQDHMKRMLAFATISFVGTFLIGLGTLGEDGVAGAAMFIVADGLTKAALFGAVGILQHRKGEVYASRLRGAGRDIGMVAVPFALGALGFAALPGFGAFEAKALIEDALTATGREWAIPALVLGPMLSCAAVLKLTAVVFLGWGGGPAEEGTGDGDDDPERAVEDHVSWALSVPTALLIAGSIAIGVIPGAAEAFLRAAHAFTDGGAYRGAILQGAETALAPVPGFAAKPTAFLLSALTLAGAVAIAAISLRAREGSGAARFGARAIAPLKAVHSGHVGDYVAWVVLGIAAFGGAFALAAA